MPIEINLNKATSLRDYDVHTDYIENYPFVDSITLGKNSYDLHLMEGSKNHYLLFKQRPYKGVYKCIASVPLKRNLYKGIPTYHPEYTQIDSEMQGKGLAAAIYSKIAETKVLRSGKCQSRGSMKLWYTLAKSKLVEVYTYYKDEWMPVEACDIEKTCYLYEKDLYEQNSVLLAISASN